MNRNANVILNRFLIALMLGLWATRGSAYAPRLMERLGRGVVAIDNGSGQAFISWRMLGTDPQDIAFNVYRQVEGETAVRLNDRPTTDSTCWIDTPVGSTAAYYVCPVKNGLEQAPSNSFTYVAGRTYLSIPLQSPPIVAMPDGNTYTYRPNDCSVGDLDGDGEYEIVVKWDPSNSKDNSQSGYTGDVWLDAYKLDGTRLWRIDLGRNIRAGAHYTQFMVYDLDSDGRAEVACKTADGTVDGVGNVIGDAAADYRNASGYVLAGPEYLTIFDGLTGAALATTDYIPPRAPDTLTPSSSELNAIWGDGYGNRCDRFLACVAYLDGVHPSLVMCRGYYTRTTLTAWNWRGGQLTQLWAFDTYGHPEYSSYCGQGDHNLSVADVDGDGKDEIIYGSEAFDDDGKPLYNTNLQHGDAIHCSVLDPSRPGLQVWACHEDYATNGGIGLSFRDAGTGQVFWTIPGAKDVGRALTADIDPRYPGCECWGATGGLYSAQGVQIASSPPSSMNFAIWWDGGLLRDLLDGSNNDAGGTTTPPWISKWDWTTNSLTRLLTATGCYANNSTKATPCLSADILGDWREEVIWRSSDAKELRIYTTTIPTTHRFYTLMHDPVYRLSVAWQNTAYNQPPEVGFFLGDGMTLPPPTPNIELVGDQPTAAGNWLLWR